MPILAFTSVLYLSRGSTKWNLPKNILTAISTLWCRKIDQTLFLWRDIAGFRQLSNQPIYIDKWMNLIIIVECKINSIVLDQCNKVSLQIILVVSLVEFINWKIMTAQVIDRVLAIEIETTDGYHIYLSLHTELITSKSSLMNPQALDVSIGLVFVIRFSSS